MKNLALHNLLRWKMIILPIILTTSHIHFPLKCWENVLFELGSESQASVWGNIFASGPNTGELVWLHGVEKDRRVWLSTWRSFHVNCTCRLVLLWSVISQVTFIWLLWIYIYSPCSLGWGQEFIRMYKQLQYYLSILCNVIDSSLSIEVEFGKQVMILS